MQYCNVNEGKSGVIILLSKCINCDENNMKKLYTFETFLLLNLQILHFALKGLTFFILI